MARIHSIAVFCGSQRGGNPAFAAAATALGRGMAKAGIRLVYGGGRIGLMGVLADAVLAGGGRVVGIIPERLRAAEVAHRGVSELVVVPTMHDRKREMAERSEAFAVLPGGIGTLDEMFEMLTWRQLRLHDKPIFLVDLGGYWQKLRALLDHLDAHAFTPAVVPRLLQVVPTVPALMAALAATRPEGLTRSELL